MSSGRALSTAVNRGRHASCAGMDVGRRDLVLAFPINRSTDQQTQRSPGSRSSITRLRYYSITKPFWRSRRFSLSVSCRAPPEFRSAERRQERNPEDASPDHAATGNFNDTQNSPVIPTTLKRPRAVLRSGTTDSSPARSRSERLASRGISAGKKNWRSSPHAVGRRAGAAGTAARRSTKDWKCPVCIAVIVCPRTISAK